MPYSLKVEPLRQRSSHDATSDIFENVDIGTCGFGDHVPVLSAPSRPTAFLGLWHNDVAAFGREHADRGRVDSAKEDALDAAEQQPYAQSPRPTRRVDNRDCLRPAREGQRRRQRFQGLDSARQALQDSRRSHETLHSYLLVQP